MRARFRAALAARYSLRLHMLAMIVAMVAMGVVTTSVLRGAGLESMALRYPIVVVVAYGGFLVFVWLWIRFFVADREAHPPLPEAAVAALAAMPTRRQSDGIGGDLVEAAGEVTEATVDGSFSIDVGDGEGAIVVVVIGVVVAVLMGLGAYAIWEAPAILGDALFQAALGAAVRRSVCRADTDHWLSSVWGATWWMVLLAVVLSVTAGWVLELHCEGATTAVDSFRCEP